MRHNPLRRCAVFGNSSELRQRTQEVFEKQRELNEQIPFSITILSPQGASSELEFFINNIDENGQHARIYGTTVGENPQTVNLDLPDTEDPFIISFPLAPPQPTNAVKN